MFLIVRFASFINDHRMSPPAKNGADHTRNIKQHQKMKIIDHPIN
jgi:hypothetical protein